MTVSRVLKLVEAQNRAMEANGSRQVAEAAVAELAARWAGIEPGMECRLTPEALRQAQGDGDPLRLDSETTRCAVLRISPERDCALVVIECYPSSTGVPGTIANEYGREAILLPDDFPEDAPQQAGPPPPAPRTPSPVDRERLRAISTRGRGRNPLPVLW